jgi:uncharacterized protein (TIGR01777 family)
MKIVITGSSGLIGNVLVKELQAQHHTIIPLIHESNKQTLKKDFTWNIFSKKLDIKAFENVDCVIHLAGRNIGKPWTKTHKSSIYNSRIDGTNLLFQMFKEHNILPKHFISASAIGYYHDPVLDQTDESGLLGNGFLAKVCSDWEKAALQMESLGIKTSIVRTGLVLSNNGGVLPIMNKFRKLGVVPTTGSPKNIWSWIHINDLVNIYIDLIHNKLPNGIYNGVSPNPCTQGKIAKTILLETRNQKQSILPINFTPNVPAFLLKTILGERSILTLTNQNIYPSKLLNESFAFGFPTIELAIENLIHGK